MHSSSSRTVALVAPHRIPNFYLTFRYSQFLTTFPRKFKANTMGRIFLSLLLSLFTIPTVFSQPYAHVGLPPEVWVNQLMDNGVGQILNVSITGTPEQFAWFENLNNSALYPQAGLVFSTGIAGTYYPPNGTNMGESIWDADIFSLSGLPQGYDPVILTVDFVASTNQLNFNYAFGSDEFPQFTCSEFNDVVGIFLSGPGITGNQNISAIHPGNYPLGVESVFCFNAYPYIQLSPPTPFNGITEPLIQTSIAVQPCGIYTLKILLADISDAAYDSGLYFGRISPGNTNNITINTENRVYVEGCESKPLLIEFDLLSTYGFAQYTIGGTATPNVDYTLDIPLSDTVPASGLFSFFPHVLADSILDEFETIDINLFGDNCEAGLLRFFITDLLPTDTAICNDDTIPAFGLPAPIDYVFSSNGPPIPYTYQTITSTLDVNNIPFDLLFTPNMIKEICIEYTGLNNSYSNIYLQSPDNTLLKLSIQHPLPYAGKICFAPDALAPISSIANASGPDFGKFQPDGDWEHLGGRINGEWKLRWAQIANSNELTDMEWQLSFTKEFMFDEFQYAWPNGLSSQAIPVTADSAQVFSVHVFNDLVDCTKEVKVTPIEPDITELSFMACEGDSLEYHGIVLGATNPTATIELQNIHGCDSLVQLTLGFYETPIITLIDTLCNDGKLIVGEFVFDIDNPAGSVTLQDSLHECDSIVQVQLYFYEASMDTLILAITEGDYTVVGVDTFTEAGEYTVILEDVHGCDSTVALQLSVLTDADETIRGTAMVSIFPNPASSTITIATSTDVPVFDITLYNSLGQLVQHHAAPCAACTLSVADLPSGIYVVAYKMAHDTCFRKIEILR